MRIVRAVTTHGSLTDGGIVNSKAIAIGVQKLMPPSCRERTQKTAKPISGQSRWTTGA